jgi:hypothetical protein
MRWEAGGVGEVTCVMTYFTMAKPLLIDGMDTIPWNCYRPWNEQGR